MNAIQWMVNPPNPKRFMPPRPEFSVEDMRKCRSVLRSVLEYVQKPVFQPNEWRIARNFATVGSANREIAIAVKLGLVECISPAVGGGYGATKPRPAVYKVVTYEA